MRPLAVLGDSHLAALRRGYDLDPRMTGGRSVAFHPFGAGSSAVRPFHEVASDGASVRMHGKGWRNLTLHARSFTEPGGQDAIVALSLPLHSGRVLRDVGWDRHVPWSLVRQEGDGEGEIALSDQAVAAILQDDYRHALAFAEALGNLGLRLLVIEAPRPFDHAPFLSRMRLDVCQHVDRTYRTEVRARLQAAGVPVVDQPDATVSQDQTTLPAYRHETPGDFLHANAAYGQLAMASVLAAARALD